MTRGRLNVHDGPCGTLTAILSDLEIIWGTAIQNMLDIPLKDLKVTYYAPPPKKWQGIMLYPLKFWVSVRPSVSTPIIVCPQLLLQF